MKKKCQLNNQKGFVTTIVLIIVALVALKYALHFDFGEYLKSPGPQATINKIINWIKLIYNWIDKIISGFFKK